MATSRKSGTGKKKRSPVRSKKPVKAGGRKSKGLGAKTKASADDAKRRKRVRAGDAKPGKRVSKADRRLRGAGRKDVRRGHVPATKKKVAKKPLPKRKKPAPRPAPKKKKPAHRPSPKKKKPAPRKPRKPVPRPKPKRPRKPAPRPEPPRRKPPRPPAKKPKRPKRPLPLGAVDAETTVRLKLVQILEELEGVIIEASMDLKTFINADGTVDGELRLGNLPEEFRTEDGIVVLEKILSQTFRKVGVIEIGDEGGGYFISLGVRFGPQNDAEIGELAEMYKRHRGLFQVAAYPTMATEAAGLQNNVVGMGAIAKSLMSKRGILPSVIIVRFTWTPDGTRPERYQGEKGGGR